MVSRSTGGGRRGGLQSRWVRGGGILILAATLGWLLIAARQVEEECSFMDGKQSCILSPIFLMSSFEFI